MNVLKPQDPYRVEGMTEYRGCTWEPAPEVDRTHGGAA